MSRFALGKPEALVFHINFRPGQTLNLSRSRTSQHCHPQYGDTDGIAAFGFQISQRLPHFGKISSAQKFVALASAGLSRMCDGVSLNNPPFDGVIEDYGQIAGYLERRAFTSPNRSEEHTSELQSLMRISHAVFCLKK